MVLMTDDRSADQIRADNRAAVRQILGGVSPRKPITTDIEGGVFTRVPKVQRV
jgi:hypothetical protein